MRALSALLLTLLAYTAGAAEEQAPEYVALADPARLQAIKDHCYAISDTLRGSSRTPDQIDGLQQTYECLLEAAVKEFRESVATKFFTTEEFEARLRRLTDEEAQLIVDINIKHARDFPPGTMWGPIGLAIRVGLAEDYLDEIWRYYENNCPASRC